MKKYTTEAIVLKSINYKDADRIYTLLTRDHGKISALARGVRKISSRRSGNLDSLNHVSIKLTERSNGFRNIDEVKTLRSHMKMKDDYSKLTSAYYLSELVHKAVEEDSSVAEIYALLLASLGFLDGDVHLPKLITARFEVLLLKFLGYDIDGARVTGLVSKPPVVDAVKVSGGKGRGYGAFDLSFLGDDVQRSASKSSQNIFDRIKGFSWHDITLEELRSTEMIIKSYIYSYLVDNIKSLEIV
jgi:DNA repair protein RecO